MGGIARGAGARRPVTVTCSASRLTTGVRVIRCLPSPPPPFVGFHTRVAVHCSAFALRWTDEIIRPGHLRTLGVSSLRLRLTPSPPILAHYPIAPRLRDYFRQRYADLWLLARLRGCYEPLAVLFMSVWLAYR